MVLCDFLPPWLDLFRFALVRWKQVSNLLLRYLPGFSGLLQLVMDYLVTYICKFFKRLAILLPCVCRGFIYTYPFCYDEVVPLSSLEINRISYIICRCYSLEISFKLHYHLENISPAVSHLGNYSIIFCKKYHDGITIYRLTVIMVYGMSSIFLSKLQIIWTLYPLYNF